MSGKGSTPRPFSVKDDVFAENYCKAFGHKERAGRCMNCGVTLQATHCKEQAVNSGIQEGAIRESCWQEGRHAQQSHG